MAELTEYFYFGFGVAVGIGERCKYVKYVEASPQNASKPVSLFSVYKHSKIQYAFGRAQWWYVGVLRCGSSKSQLVNFE